MTRNPDSPLIPILADLLEGRGDVMALITQTEKQLRAALECALLAGDTACLYTACDEVWAAFSAAGIRACQREVETHGARAHLN